MADEKIQIEVSVTGDGEIKIRKLIGATEELGKVAEKSFSTAAAAAASFVGNLGADAAKKALGSLVDGVLFLKDAILEGVEAAQEQEDAMNSLAQAFAASGQASEENLSAFDEFASSIQKTTKFSDDQVISAGALIQTIGQLKGDALPGATQAALNLSAAFGKDLTTAAELVGKAANGNVAALGKMGIEVRKGKTDAETFANALSAIESRALGAALATGNTFSGRVRILGNAWGEAKEKIGTAVITNQSLINVLGEVAKIVQAVDQAVGENKDAFQELISSGIIFAIDAVQVFVGTIEALERYFIRLSNTIKLPMAGLFSFTDALGITNKAALATAKSIESGLNKVRDIDKGATGLGEITAGLERIRQSALSGFGESASGAKRAGASASAAASGVKSLTDAQEKLIQQGEDLAKQGQAKDPNVEFQLRSEALKAALEADKISYEEHNAAIVAFEQERFEKVSALRAADADLIIQQNRDLTSEDLFANESKIAANQAGLKEILKNENLTAKDRQRIESAYAQQSRIIEAQRAQAVSNSLNALASLQTAKTAELAAVGKAAAIAQATIDTYKGAGAAASALAGIPFVGPALAAAAAAAFIAAGLVRVGQIAGVPLATGITEVPSGFANDTFPARLSSGERVLSTNQNEDLKSGLVQINSLAPILVAILEQLRSQTTHVQVNLGSKLIFDEIRSGLESGRVLAA